MDSGFGLFWFYPLASDTQDVASVVMGYVPVRVESEHVLSAANARRLAPHSS